MWHGRNDGGYGNYRGGGGGYTPYGNDSDGYGMNQMNNYGGGMMGQGGGDRDMISASKLIGTISQMAQKGGFSNNRLAGALDLIQSAMQEVSLGFIPLIMIKLGYFDSQY